MSDRMTAITLKHPWPYAVAELGKRTENRSWRPPNSAIKRWHGIHGGAEPKGRNLEEAEDDLDLLIDSGLSPEIHLKEAVRPGIIGVWWLDRAIHESNIGEPLLKDPWFSGPYGWIFPKVVVFREPIPCKGAQGLWVVPPQIHEEMRRRYAEATGVNP